MKGQIKEKLEQMHTRKDVQLKVFLKNQYAFATFCP